MKKILKISVLFIFCFVLFSLGKAVQANSISSISMDIYVDNNGNAKITEIWKCNTNQGTEVYHPYYNLGNSKIQNLIVSENGENYSTLSSWKTSGSLESKAYKCGINKISNGVELCWGISKYGNHTYTVNYEITNFVSSLTDSQMIYWTLIPYEFSNSIGKAYIKIHTDFSISDTTDVWGYGNYGGTAYVYDGYIEMQSDGALSKSEYMTILVKFPQGTFNTTNSLNHNFKYYYDMSQKGSTSYKGNGNGTHGLNKFLENIFIIVCASLVPSIIIIIHGVKTINIGGTGDPAMKKKGKLSSDIPYFRDIPCEKNLFRIYYIANTYGLMKQKTDILGAIILNWLKNSLIRIEQREAGSIIKREDIAIILNETNPNVIKNANEQRLFRLLLTASKDGVLESKEFEKWCKGNYYSILSWFDDVIKSERNRLVTEGLITVEEKTGFKIFKYKEYSATPELIKMAEEISGLKRYLLDYTLIKERQAIEVHLFEDYLICAQILGIAKKVAKEFKNLYPEIIEQSNFNSYDNIIFINMYASNGVYVANSAKSRAESYSSGGGGYSSGGGGGGSFGGGGGRWRLPLKS